MKIHYQEYIQRLNMALAPERADEIEVLAKYLLAAWENKRQVFLCGNGGSAGNAIHLANDFNYGIDKGGGMGLRVEALSANAAVITCLANDEGYETIYSQQVQVKGNPGDILIILSGSGNSPNVVKALEAGNQIGLETFAILGFSGGKCKSIAKHAIHFPINDMQIAEDLQLIVGHICMQWLYSKGKGE